MKTRTKILLALLAALIFFSFERVETGSDPCKQAPAKPSLSILDLYAWYAGYNEVYFNNSLPKNIVIDYEEYSDLAMATTGKDPDGRFHIRFNPEYTKAQRAALSVLIHEQCHIETWGYDPILYKDGHTPEWQGCMLRVDKLGAFRKILIDHYGGN